MRPREASPTPMPQAKDMAVQVTPEQGDQGVQVEYLFSEEEDLVRRRKRPSSRY